MKVTVAWYRARCFLLSENEETFDLARFFELALECDHPDARLLCSIIDPTWTEISTRTVLCWHENQVARLYGMDMSDYRPAPIGIDHPLFCSGFESVIFDDPRGLVNMGKHTRDARWFRKAADMGSRNGMRYYARAVYKIDDIRRYQWLERSNPKTAGIILGPQEIQYLKHNEQGAIKYYIGRILDSLTCSDVDYGAVSYYQRELRNAQRATITWLLCAPRLGIYKDLAHLIGRLLYAARFEPTLK